MPPEGADGTPWSLTVGCAGSRTTTPVLRFSNPRSLQPSPPVSDRCRTSTQCCAPSVVTSSPAPPALLVAMAAWPPPASATPLVVHPAPAPGSGNFVHESPPSMLP